MAPYFNFLNYEHLGLRVSPKRFGETHWSNGLLEPLKEEESISPLILRPAESAPVRMDLKEEVSENISVFLIVTTWSFPMLALWLFKALGSGIILHGDLPYSKIFWVEPLVDEQPSISSLIILILGSTFFLVALLSTKLKLRALSNEGLWTVLNCCFLTLSASSFGASLTI